MIKFRAWDKQEKRMLVVYRISFDGPIEGAQVHCYLDDRGSEGSTEYSYDGDGLILEQFTGLKDVNGKDIYEGDILHFGSIWCVGDEYDPREEEHIGAVEYHPDYASYVVNCNGKKYPLEQLISFDGYSVQGNVHENLELLEEEK
ncbi:YopX family protein [Lactiplantibacillus pentosus]|nr:YopX family protein [Lactiplantibacillus pentosus]AYJ41580.1 hypothetical protein LP314_06600 [Lactiplantibacillus pentosus]MCT3301281.1 hypothetical protein [Lactiplantibacillus pentosus]MCT3313152.1 hypothetical protein [Lactiplantibacillus pentosus]PKX55619.1 hypothetical protein BIS22_09365 [Lactiplantibacillus pentosus]TDG92727.1 hypothetical protein C5L29_001157 [Lactiplantibacillus pentosus]